MIMMITILTEQRVINKEKWSKKDCEEKKEARARGKNMIVEKSRLSVEQWKIIMFFEKERHRSRTERTQLENCTNTSQYEPAWVKNGNKISQKLQGHAMWNPWRDMTDKTVTPEMIFCGDGKLSFSTFVDEPQQLKDITSDKFNNLSTNQVTLISQLK